MPKISVIMPVYNAEKFLAEAVDSILQQTFEDFELLCVNDGSTDRSGEILASYADKRLQVFNQSNQGIVASLNFLLRQAEAPLVARADADDIYSPDRLELQYASLQAEPHIGVVGTFAMAIDENGNEINPLVYFQQHDAIVRHLRIGSAFAHPSVMFRRDLVLAAGGYDLKFQHAEDYDLWIKLSTKTRFANLPHLAIRYRQHGGSICAKQEPEQVQLTRRIRTAFWQSLPEENPIEWESQHHELIDNQLEAASGPVSREMVLDHILRCRLIEANLAAGAKRNDIGRRCLYELSMLQKKPVWRSLYALSGVVGFRSVWKGLRAVFGSKFEQVLNQPLHEW